MRSCLHAIVIALCTGWLAPAAAGQAAQEVKDCAVCPILVDVPGGQFVMGTAPGEEDRERLGDEFRDRSIPQRRVTVSRFLAGKFEVTRQQYESFVNATGHQGRGCFQWAGSSYRMNEARDWRDPGYPQGPEHPVVCVSWEDAVAYAAWLTRLTGKAYRLLSEAEWEYVARAGTQTARHWGDTMEGACRHANVADRSLQRGIPVAAGWPAADCDDGFVYTAPVGSFQPNAFGLHDMLGNAWEWTQDCWRGDYTGAPAGGGPRTDADCSMRSVRGGSWDDGPSGIRAAYRVGSPVTIRVYPRGFRVAREP